MKSNGEVTVVTGMNDDSFSEAVREISLKLHEAITERSNSQIETEINLMLNVVSGIMGSHLYSLIKYVGPLHPIVLGLTAHIEDLPTQVLNRVQDCMTNLEAEENKY